jgi:hypothetical protein
MHLTNKNKINIKLISFFKKIENNQNQNTSRLFWQWCACLVMAENYHEGLLY